jgi:hypothetical protein
LSLLVQLAPLVDVYSSDNTPKLSRIRRSRVALSIMVGVLSAWKRVARKKRKRKNKNT